MRDMVLDLHTSILDHHILTALGLMTGWGSLTFQASLGLHRTWCHHMVILVLDLFLGQGWRLDTCQCGNHRQWASRPMVGVEDTHLQCQDRLCQDRRCHPSLGSNQCGIPSGLILV